MTGRLIARPRLVQLLHERWQRRLVLVTAGAGFGKSSALAEAVAENALAPRGTDVLVECSPADRTSGALSRRIAASAGIAVPETPPADPIEWLLAELACRSPLGACLLLDDAHHADPRAIHQIVASAPRSLHLVLATRTTCAGLTRLRAAGEVLDIDEDDLRLSSTELAHLARSYGVEPSSLEAVDGWPAAAAMAATYGIGGAEDYLFETAATRLSAAHRRLLAVALAIGGGDAELLQVACGPGSLDPATALAGLPLVRRSDAGDVIVHDLWRGVLGDAIGPRALDAAVSRAVALLARRGHVEQAFSLCAARGDWDRAATVIRACCRRGHPDVPSHVAEEWLAAMPVDRRDEPDGLLLRGLVGRVRNPLDAATADVLARAVAAFRQCGDVAGEVAAGVALCHVLRNQGRTGEIAGFIARALELDAAGHPEAAGPAAFGRALLAEIEGDDATMISRLEAVPAESLSPDWRVATTFRIAMGHLVLGNREPMLRAADRCTELARGPYGHIASLVRWFAGDPEPMLAKLDEFVADTRDGGIHAVQLGSAAAMVAASIGQLPRAREALSIVDSAVTGPLQVLLDGAVVGARALAAAAAGDDDSARVMLERALHDSPLSDRHGWRRAVRWLPLAYVLVPATRPFLDEGHGGELHQRRLDAARAVVWAREREGRPPAAVAAMATPMLCTSVPLPWAMALAARLAKEGSSAGARVAGELLDRFGEPAKDALRAAAADPSKHVSSGAKSLLATIASPPGGRTVRLSVLGPTTLDAGIAAPNAHWNRDRVRSLLVFLALRRSASRDELCDALWAHLDVAAAERNLRVTLCYLQQVLEPERRTGEASFFIRQTGSLVSMAPEPFVVVDAEDFAELVRRAAEADDRGQHSLALGLLDEALELWRGSCLADVALEEWAQADRHQLESGFVRAATRAGQLHLAAGRPARAASCADRALRVDEWSESAYQLKIAAALQLGDRARAARELAGCDAMLAELGVSPDERTEALRRRLQERCPATGHAATA